MSARKSKLSVTVEYSLTPLGRTLTETFDVLRQWAETHINEVEGLNIGTPRLPEEAI